MTRAGRRFTAMALAVLATTLPALEASAQSSCRWDGTAVFCDGSCGGDETEMTRAAAGPAGLPPGVQVSADFGNPCLTGTKALCCKMTGFSCRWDGTAPFCEGSCQAGETRGDPPPGSSSGNACWTGSKAYCCHSTRPPPTATGTSRLEANPKWVRYAALWDRPLSSRVATRLRPHLGDLGTGTGAAGPAGRRSAGRAQPEGRGAQVGGRGTGVEGRAAPVDGPGVVAGARTTLSAEAFRRVFAVEKGPLIQGTGAAALDPGPAPPSGAAWQARNGLASARFQEVSDALERQGYRLVELSGYGVGDEAAYAGVWEQSPGPAWAARRDLSPAQYQQEQDRLAGRGYRLVRVSAFTVGDQVRYAAIWEKRAGRPWVARHGLSAAEFQREFQARAAQGWRLVDVSGFHAGGQDAYAAIWEQGPGPAWEAHHGMTSAEYQQLLNAEVKRGFRLKRVSAWPAGEVAHFAAIWEQGGTGAWVARHAMASDDYQEQFDKMLGQGFRLRAIAGYYVE